MWKEIAIWLHHVRPRPEIFASQYVFGLQCRDNFITPFGATLVHFKYCIVMTIPFVRIVCQHSDAWNISERSGVRFVVALVAFDYPGMPIEIRQPHPHTPRSSCRWFPGGS